MTEGLDPQEKEINAEFPLPPVNLGKDRATLGSRSGIRPRDLRVDQEQVQDPYSPAEHCGDPHCGDRHLGSPPLGGGTTLATELSGTSAFSGTRGTQGRGQGPAVRGHLWDTSDAVWGDAELWGHVAGEDCSGLHFRGPATSRPGCHPSRAEGALLDFTKCHLLGRPGGCGSDKPLFSRFLREPGGWGGRWVCRD